MRHLFCYVLLGWISTIGNLSAQEGIQRGKIKNVDAAKGRLTITVEGKDLDLTVA